MHKRAFSNSGVFIGSIQTSEKTFLLGCQWLENLPILKFSTVWGGPQSLILTPLTLLLLRTAPKRSTTSSWRMNQNILQTLQGRDLFLLKFYRGTWRLICSEACVNNGKKNVRGTSSCRVFSEGLNHNPPLNLWPCRLRLLQGFFGRMNADVWRRRFVLLRQNYA